jgi:hypothetical protein
MIREFGLHPCRTSAYISDEAWFKLGIQPSILIFGVLPARINAAARMAAENRQVRSEGLTAVVIKRNNVI